MADTDNTANAEEPKAAPAAKAPKFSDVKPVAPDTSVTLEAFIASAFRGGGEAALLGGFQHEEQRLGHHRDTPDAFDSRLKAFAGRPADQNEV